jgi:hypothetical protein
MSDVGCWMWDLECRICGTPALYFFNTSGHQESAKSFQSP